MNNVLLIEMFIFYMSKVNRNEFCFYLVLVLNICFKNACFRKCDLEFKILKYVNSEDVLYMIKVT